MKTRSLAFFLAALICATAAAAQSPKVERTTIAPEGVSTELKTALEDKGYRITLSDGWTAEIWLAHLQIGSVASTEALYPEFSNGEFIGVLHLPKGMSDFRGQAVPAGTYTLRYHLLPQDANHMGASPNPDFLLAIPIASDTKPEAVYSSAKLAALSSKTTGSHPAVLALEAAGDPGTAVLNEQKLLVLTVFVSSIGGKPKPLGIVLRGQATQ